MTHNLRNQLNPTQVFRATEFFQVRDLLPVCGDFIRREVVTKSNFIQILKVSKGGGIKDRIWVL